MDNYLLRLYITGKTVISERAVANLNRICKEELNDQYKLEIIDILENPELAEKERIFATPTLIRQLPLPVRRVIGDLSNQEKVFLGLELKLDKKEQDL